MLWGFDGFTRGMNESDARFRKKRSENVKLFTEYKNLFPDAPIEDYQNFINETTEGSAYLKKQMPSTEALQSYVDRQELTRKRETRRIQNQTLQTDLAIGNTLTERVKQLSSNVDTIDDIRANLLGGLEVGSDQYSRISSWVDSNGPTITGAMTSSKRDLAERLAGQLKTLDPEAVKRIAQESYGLKINDTTVNMTLELARQTQDEKQRVARSKIFEDFKKDKELMTLMRSNDPSERRQGENILKRQFTDANVPWLEANASNGVEGSGAEFSERAVADYTVNSNDRQQNARLTALSDPQFKTIQSNINEMTTKQAIEMLRAIIPDEGITSSEEGEIAQALLKTMELNRDDANAKDIEKGVAQGAGIPKDDATLDRWLATKPWPDTVKAQVKIQLQLTDKLERKQKTDKWQQEAFSNPSVMSMFSTSDPKAYETLMEQYRAQSQAAGYEFDESLWARFAATSLTQKGLMQKEKILTEFSKNARYQAAVKAAQRVDGQDGAIREIINYVNSEGDRLSQTQRREVFARLFDSAGLDVGNVMNDLYTAQVTKAKADGLKEFTQRQTINADNAQVDGSIAATLFDSSIDLKKGEGDVLGTLAKQYATTSGVPSSTIRQALQAISQTDEYKGKDGLDKLIPTFDSVVTAQIMATNGGKIPSLQQQQASFISSRVNALVIEPKTLSELRGQLQRHEAGFDKVSENLMLLSDTATNGSVEAFDSKKKDLIGRLSTSIGKIKRLLTGNKIIAFESLEPLSNQLANLERKMALLQQAEHPRKIERRQQEMENRQSMNTFLLGDTPYDPASVAARGEQHMKAIKEAEENLRNVGKGYLVWDKNGKAFNRSAQPVRRDTQAFEDTRRMAVSQLEAARRTYMNYQKARATLTQGPKNPMGQSIIMR